VPGNDVDEGLVRVVGDRARDALVVVCEPRFGAHGSLVRPEDGRPAKGYVFMRRVHSREKRPYCVISIYLDERVFRKSPKRFRNETVISILYSNLELRTQALCVALPPPLLQAIHSLDMQSADLIPSIQLGANRVQIKIKKDRIDQRSPRCPDCFGPSVLSKLGFMFGKDDAKDEGELNPF